MATLTLKNVPDDLYQRLKEAAARNRRSLNQEAITRLAAADTRDQRDPEEVLRNLRDRRVSLPPHKQATLEEVDRWKREGRA